MSRLKLIINQALNELYAGLFIGALSAWIGLSSASGAQAVAANVARLFPLLYLALPIVMVMQTLRGARAPAWQWAVVGLAGGAGGVVAFFVTAINVPAVFGQLDPVGIYAALRQQIRLGAMAAAVALTVLAALAGWAWTKRTGLGKQKSNT